MKIVIFGIGIFFAIMLIVYKALYIDIKSEEALSTQHTETEMNVSNASVMTENNEKNVPIQLEKMVLLDDVLENIDTSERLKDIQELQQIITWADGIGQDVKKTTGKDYSCIADQLKKKKIFQVRKNIYSTEPKLILEPNTSINSLNNAFLLVIGDCKISYTENSIVVCTGDVDIKQSGKNIIVAGGDIRIFYDGWHHFSFTPEKSEIKKDIDYIGSLIYSKKNIDVAHSSKSVFLSAQHIHVNSVRQSSCINTGPINASHGSFEYYIIDKNENYTTMTFKEWQGKVYPVKKLDKNIYQTSNNPTSIAEEFCYSIKQQEFEISKMLIDPSLMESFDEEIKKVFFGKHQEEAMRKFAKWSCRVSEMEHNENEAEGRINGLGRIELKKINGLWKVNHY